MRDAKILIVEDEAIEAMDIQQRLASLGYPLPDIAHNGEEGVRKVEETQPDLVLMDIMMPGKLDGVAAAARIRSRFDIPIIFLTAYADDNTLQRAKETEPYGYVVKPFQERELRITVDMALYKHAMERKLREKEKWFETTLRSIGDGVIATDAKGMITFMNPVAEELMGWKLEEVRQKNLTEVFNIVNCETRKQVENPVTRVIREGVIVGLANHTVLISRDGKEVSIHDSAAPIRDDKGNIIGVILVFSDITERENTQKALKHANAELEAANRELESFIYSVSHDLRAPLRTVSEFARILMEDYSDNLNEEGKNYLIRVGKGAGKMNRLIEDLLYLSRITRQDLVRSDINMEKIAERIVTELRDASRDRRVEVEIQPSLKAHADPRLMEVALSNIIGNAWKFTSKTEKARIAFGAVDSPLRIAECPISGESAGTGGLRDETAIEQIKGKTVYYVKDNGAGFDQNHAEKMFWPFQRLHTEREFEGMGIGLTIVERVIRRHGGKIWAEGEPGKGATVYFTVG